MQVRLTLPLSIQIYFKLLVAFQSSVGTRGFFLSCTVRCYGFGRVTIKTLPKPQTTHENSQALRVNLVLLIKRKWHIFLVSNDISCVFTWTPSEQPASFATVLSPCFIMLTWSPPDNPNGIIIRYQLYRNSTQIYRGLNRTFNDMSLTPDAVFYYYIITYTESGITRSLDDGRVYRTFQDAPGDISPPSITNILPRNVTASWQLPSSSNGRVIDYRLISTSSRSSSVEVIHYRGIIFACDVGGLRPYNWGCGRSNVTTIVTAPTLPDFQPAPTVTSFAVGKAVEVEWDEPPEPNGRILRY